MDEGCRFDCGPRISGNTAAPAGCVAEVPPAAPRIRNPQLKANGLPYFSPGFAEPWVAGKSSDERAGEPQSGSVHRRPARTEPLCGSLLKTEPRLPFPRVLRTLGLEPQGLLALPCRASISNSEKLGVRLGNPWFINVSVPRMIPNFGIWDQWMRTFTAAMAVVLLPAARVHHSVNFDRIRAVLDSFGTPLTAASKISPFATVCSPAERQQPSPARHRQHRPARLRHLDDRKVVEIHDAAITASRR